LDEVTLWKRTLLQEEITEMYEAGVPTPTNTYYLDFDGDNFGDLNSAIDAQSAPQNYVSNSTDCDDSNANVNPSASEVCSNGVDDNCDGEIDEGCVIEPNYDLNDDGVIDLFDLITVGLNYETSNELADVNNDGIVDVNDLVAIAENFS